MLWICTLPKPTPFIFEFKMWVLRGVTAGTWTCSPLKKRGKTSTTTTTNQFLGSKFQPFLFVRGPKVVGWQWGIEFTLREFYSIHKPPNSPIFPDSYFPTSPVWNLSHWKHEFGLIPIMVVRWNIILKYTNRSKFHKRNGWDLPTKEKYIIMVHQPAKNHKMRWNWRVGDPRSLN